jgi:hypothetical protein
LAAADGLIRFCGLSWRSRAAPGGLSYFARALATAISTFARPSLK